MATKYSRDQAKQMWESIAFKTDRQYAFYNGTRWYHPDVFFNDFDDFFQYLCRYNVCDVHVKSLPNQGGREWVVDVDIDETRPKYLELKIKVATQTFKSFFGSSVSRIMHSGNRGVHVWLRIDRFRVGASKETRQKFFKIFEMPDKIDCKKITPGCFIHCLYECITSPSEIKTLISQLYDDHLDGVDDTEDPSKLQFYLKELWPTVDRQIFCNLNQIRAPFSYNYKGRKHSYQLC